MYVRGTINLNLSLFKSPDKDGEWGRGGGGEGRSRVKIHECKLLPQTDLFIFLLHITKDNYSNITVDFDKILQKVLLFSSK